MKKLKILILLPLIFVMTGCQRGDKQLFDEPTITLVMKTLNNPFFMDMQKGAEDAAKKLKVNLVVQAAEREVDVEKQMQIIENLIQRKVAAICVTPSGSREIVPAIIKANKADILVLVLDTRVDSSALTEAGGHYAVFIGSDNYDGGRIAGDFILEKLAGKGKIAILEGIPGHETGDERLKGFHSSVDGRPGIKIVTSQTANWERDQGFNVFQNILQSNPEVQALFACNDLMALGAIEAIAAANRTGEIIVVGFDAINDARTAIRNNSMAGSVAQNPYDMGRIAIENALKLINGETILKEIPVKIELITKDNVN